MYVCVCVSWVQTLNMFFFFCVLSPKKMWKIQCHHCRNDVSVCYSGVVSVLPCVFVYFAEVLNEKRACYIIRWFCVRFFFVVAFFRFRLRGEKIAWHYFFLAIQFNSIPWFRVSYFSIKRKPQVLLQCCCAIVFLAMSEITNRER